MKPRSHNFSVALPILLAFLAGILFVPGGSFAQEPVSVWGSTGWWDWSDFRTDSGVRFYLAKLDSLKLSDGLLEPGFGSDNYALDDPEPWREFYFTLYVDRLGVRFHVAEDCFFRGRTGGEGVPADSVLTSHLDLSGIRVGLDLDLVRYPWAKLGINFDYHNSPVNFNAKYYPGGGDPDVEYILGDEPLTIGVHARLIPFRIREVPVTAQARFRFPLTQLPYLQRPHDARVTEWEVSVGMRPNVWETSMLAHSTFSASVNLGYRRQALEMTSHDDSIALRAVWDAVFFQIGLWY